jgi:probable H4MPT-linked C1 transfer pathway protein
MTDLTFGWDIGGAHLKAALVADGAVRDVAQWPCPLWLGAQQQLEAAFAAAHRRWPQLRAARHAVTMTGEMADCFVDRAAGVAALAQCAQRALGDVSFFAGETWLDAAQAPAHWRRIASANWRASAAWIARGLDTALLIDVGSTTTDIVPIAAGRVAARGDSDPTRLASGELVYQGVVRTPLAVLAPRIVWRGIEYNVMNELFATAADVYRLTGELDPAFDQHPAADQAGKDRAATCRRLARMIGHDGGDAPEADWVALARAFRAAQLALIEDSAARVLAAAALDARAPLVAAGCGDFLVRALAQRLGRRWLPFEALAPVRGAAAARWARVCAPSAAVALLAAHDAAAPAAASRAASRAVCGS